MKINKIKSPDYDRLLAMIYHGTGYIVSFHNKVEEVKQIVKQWLEQDKCK